MGADDAVIISDVGLEGSDVWGTASVLAAALRKHGFDLIVCGTQSTDAITGELPGALAERLGVPGLTYLRALTLEGTTVRGERETDTGYQRIRAELPALVSVTKSINEPRYPSLKGIMGAKKKPIAIESSADVGLERSAVAKTEVLAVAAAPGREPGRVVNAANAEAGADAILAFLQEKKLL
ncbi:MAG: electron transfer flavoprotein subunit beta, partial [Candidatus Baltobacteraceae bacterium]